ncbi:MAG: thioredoxin family protein, partial [Gemmatimonadota bacterium]
MTRTASTMLPLGTVIPEFALPDAVSGEVVRSSDLADGRAVLVMFLCNHCPFVRHVVDEVSELAREYGRRGVGIVAINANDLEAYPQDAPDRMRRLAEEKGWEFPFLFDETQETAKSFRAACTPDFFVFDADAALAYR